jgi:hypothetical protein
VNIRQRRTPKRMTCFLAGEGLGQALDIRKVHRDELLDAPFGAVALPKCGCLARRLDDVGARYCPEIRDGLRVVRRRLEQLHRRERVGRKPRRLATVQQCSPPFKAQRTDQIEGVGAKESVVFFPAD